MNEHILIVDDEQDFRFSSELALKRQGYKISESGDGAEAFALILEAERNPPQFDLILLDMDLPSLSGIEIIKKLHELKIILPTLVLSGNLQSNIYIELLGLGCSDIFYKPISEKALIAGVAKIFQRIAQG